MELDRRSFLGSGLIQHLKPWQEALLIAPAITGLVLVANFTGLLQFLEWAALDQFFNLRPLEPIDPRITVVLIDEADITSGQSWPISDAVLTQAIQNLKQHQPSVIGLDLYRDRPVPPSHEQLQRLYQSTPNLIGVEKVQDSTVAPPLTLARQDQVAFADVMLDRDRKVRRALLSLYSINDIKLSLGAKVSLLYLESKGITLKTDPQNPTVLRLGRAEFRALSPNDGGYVRAATGGYQILLNFRGPDTQFHRLSLRQVLANQIPDGLIRDRIVFIGTNLASTQDFLRIPYPSSLTQSPQTPGVYVHVNTSSQIVSAALEGRSLLQVWPDPLEWLWALAWAYLGTQGVRRLLQIGRPARSTPFVWVGMGGLLAGLGLFPLHYGLFLLGFWVPMVPSLLSFYGAIALSLLIQHQRLQGLADLDNLTQLFNRHYLEQVLQRQLLEQHPVALILCDIDHFKRYNDNYGFPTGDRCLTQIAQTLTKTVRGKNDLVARYGGEEFAVVLPHTPLDVAVAVAERIRQAVLSLELPHPTSESHPVVSLSLGVTYTSGQDSLKAKDLIELAEHALAAAKSKGRNQLAQFTLPSF